MVVVDQSESRNNLLATRGCLKRNHVFYFFCTFQNTLSNFDTKSLLNKQNSHCFCSIFNMNELLSTGMQSTLDQIPGGGGVIYFELYSAVSAQAGTS